MNAPQNASSDTVAESPDGLKPPAPAPRDGRQAQARQMEMIGRLAAGVAHDINGPTQYIGDNMRFLSDAFSEVETLLARCLEVQKASDNEEARRRAVADLVGAVQQADLPGLIEEIPKAVADSLEGVECVSRIVSSIKEFSVPGGAARQAIDVNHVVGNVLAITHSQWKDVAEATSRLAAGLPPVLCAPGALEQVLLNLVINAAQAIRAKQAGGSKEMGSIVVSTRRNGRWIEIAVEDNGTGIPEAIRDRIFEAFFTSKPAGQGSGQGLAIARAIVVEQYGGEIGVETTVGQGTTFTVTLPLATPATR